MIDVLWGMIGVAYMASDLYVYFWPATTALVVFAIWGIVKLHQLHRLRSWPFLSIIILGVATWITLLAYAVIFQADPTIHTEETQKIPVLVLELLAAASICLAGVTVALAKEIRLPILSVAMVGTWLNFAVFFVAAMSVSGVWL